MTTAEDGSGRMGHWIVDRIDNPSRSDTADCSSEPRFPGNDPERNDNVSCNQIITNAGVRWWGFQAVTSIP
jgi:hypothetical protein